MNERELKARTKRFALRVLKLVESLPQNRVSARIVTNQLGRSGTAVGANYRAACKGRSRAEFAAKIGVVEEEADESAYWLELVIESALLKESVVRPLLKEANELTAIMAASRLTATSRAGAGNRAAPQSQSQIANRQSQIRNP